MSAQAGLVSIIIVNWNTRDLLIDCLQSIEENTTDVPYEIVVLDNASADGSVDAVRSLMGNVKLIASNENLGFAAGNNRAAAEASGEFILLLNPDTVVGENAIREMRAFLTENPDAGAVGCRLLNADGSTQESFWMRFPSIWWLFLKAFYLDKLTRRFSGLRGAGRGAPFRVAHLLGACIMMRAETFRRLGGFDESYFLYLEETHLCYRLARSGYGIYYLPATSIVHLGQQSSNQAAEWANAQLYASACRFLEEQHPGSGLRTCALRVVLILTALVRLLLWSLRFAVGRPEPRPREEDAVGLLASAVGREEDSDRGRVGWKGGSRWWNGLLNELETCRGLLSSR